MTNAALELADLLESWGMEANTPMSARTQAQAGDPILLPASPVWNAHARAVKLLDQVITTIRAMGDAGKPVAQFEKAVDAWFEAVFSVNHQWVGQAYNARAIDPAALTLLRTVGLAISFTDPVTIKPSAKAELVATLQSARTLLGEVSDDLASGEIVYVLTLLNAAEMFLQEQEIVGAADLRNHLDRLNGALVAVSAQLGDQGSAETGHRVLLFALKIATIGSGILNTTAAVGTILGIDVGDVQRALGQ